MDETSREPVLVDLALQGGGSHGAFTWGVLDRLLEEAWLQIEAISGTSAGAMNAALAADGWTQGGAEGARAALAGYWRGGDARPPLASRARPHAPPPTGGCAAGPPTPRPPMSPWT